jgi:nitronate monooxygenase
MVVDAQLSDIVLSADVTGVTANWLSRSLEAARKRGTWTPDAAGLADFSGNIATDRKAWKEVWSAGQGVGAVERISTIQEIVNELADDYAALR